MQNVSYKFKRLYDDLFAKVEIKALIADVEYTKADIYNVKLTKNALKDSSPSIGGAVANTAVITVIPKGTIPRGAEVKLFLRLVGPNEVSEWIPKGTYYIYSREVSHDGLVAELTCSDGLLKANQKYLEVTTLADYWPYSDVIVAENIADICGLELDDRTIAIMTNDYQVSRPTDLTCREVLEYLAVAYGGNWTVTDENTLYLVGLVADPEVLAKDTTTAILFGDSIITLQNMSKDGKDLLSDHQDRAILFGENLAVSLGTSIDPLNIKRNAVEYSATGKLKAYTGVTLWWDDEDAFQSETFSDEGTVIEADCPYATQAMANALYEKYNGLIYSSYDVTSAHLTPAAELGDIVIVDGHAMPLLSYSVLIDGSYRPDISAPPEDEIESEYPYETATEREFERRVKLGSKYYGVTISRENGIEIVKTNSQQTFSRAILNSDVLAFYDDSGDEAIYFDSNDHEYKFVGNISLEGGKININNRFEVDTSGNTTTHGNITFVGNGSSLTPNIVMNGFMMINDESGRYRMGYIGRATGEDEDHNITEGIALGYGDPNDLFDDDNYYIICTNAGVRLQGDQNEISVTTGGAFYNDSEIATLDDTGSIWSEISDIWDAIHDLTPPPPSSGENENE